MFVLDYKRPLFVRMSSQLYSYYYQACCLLKAVFQSYIVAFINDLTKAHDILYQADILCE